MSCLMLSVNMSAQSLTATMKSGTQKTSKSLSATKSKVKLNPSNPLNLTFSQASALAKARAEKHYQQSMVGVQNKARMSRAAAAQRIAAPTNVADSTILYGLNYVDGTWQTLSKRPAHVFSFHAASTVDLTDESGTSIERPMASFYAKGKFYALNSATDDDGNVKATITVYDAKTWKVLDGPVSIGDGSWDYYFRQVAVYDPVTDKAYTMSWGTNKPLISIDLKTYETKNVGEVNQFIQTLVLDKNNNLYGISFNNRSLYKIDKATGAATRVGLANPGFSISADPQSAVTDPTSGKTYWVAVNGNSKKSYLCTMNLPDTAVTQMCEMPADEHIFGMYIPYVEAAAPAPATNISFVYNTLGSENGKLNFTVPTTTYTSGETLSGTLTAVITIDGTEETMSVTPGQVVSLDKTLTTGKHLISIIIRNAAGDGAERRFNTFTGNDVPSAVTSLTAENVSGTVKLAWKAPTTSLNGGPVDDATIGYKIVRYPDEVVVANQLKDTLYNDVLPDTRTHYYYDVISLSGTLEGGKATTAEIPGGSVYYPPFTETFATQADFDICKVIDNNNDQHTWAWMQSILGAYLTGNGVNDSETGAVATYDDDYLVSAPISMKKNTDYRLTFHCQEPYFDESMRVLLGTSQELKDTTVVLASNITVLSGATDFEKNIVFNVPADGKYNIFFHENTVGNSVNNELTDFTVDIAGAYDAPDSVTGLTAKAGEMGALTNVLTFTTPRTTYKGTALSAISRIDIYKNNGLKPVATFANPALGTVLTWSDPDVQQGLQTYRVVPFNEAGQGKTAKVINWTGIDIPSNPTNVYAKMNDSYQAVFTWDKVSTKGIHGGYVDPAAVKYVVCRYNEYNFENHWEAVTDSTTETTATDANLDLYGGQAYEDYSIVAANIAGSDDGTMIGITLGTPYERPYAESFAGGYVLNTPWTLHASSYDYAWATVTGTGLAVKPYDKDGGMLEFAYKAEDSNTQVIEGPRVSLKDAVNPELSFYMYHGNEAEPEDLSLKLYVNTDDGGFKLAATVPYNNGITGWTRYSLPMAKGANNVQIALGAYAADASAAIHIDNIRIEEAVDNDLSVEGFTATKRIVRGQTGSASVRVLNKGQKTTGDFTVTLVRDGAVYATQTGNGMKQNDVKDFNFDITTPINEIGKTFKYSAFVTLEGDGNAANDSSAVAKVLVTGSVNPTATNLTGKEVVGAIALSWNKPATDEAVDPVTEDFDSYTPFIIDSIGDWKTYDGDGLTPVYFGGPSIAHAYTPQAWQVWNPTEAGFSTEKFDVLTAHSGNQYLACWAASDGQSSILTNDDWLISSDIKGGSDINYWLRVPNSGSGAQVVEMMYSTTDREPENFVAFDRDSIEGTTNWVKLSYTLPADAKYFAVRCCSYENHTVLFMDDITYTPLYGSTSKLTLNGYNIYRDNTLLATSNDTTYLDTSAGSAAHVYVVTANWAQGESMPSNEYSVKGSADLINSAATSNIRIFGGNRTISIVGADGHVANIYTTTGAAVFSKSVNGNAIVNVAPGMYIVRVGGKVAKVMVQ